MVILYNPSIVNIYSIFGLAESDRPEISQTQQTKIKLPVIIPPDQNPSKSQKQEVSHPVPRRIQGLSDLLRDLDTRSSRHMALKVAMDLWEEGSIINHYLDTLDDNQDFFRLAAKQNDLLISRIEGDLGLVKKLNLPAILEFYLPEGLSPRYLTLSKMDDGAVTLLGGDDKDVIGTKQNEVESYWRGTAYILWKHFNDYRGTIPLDAPKDSIITLKILMKEIGYKEIEMSPFYDDQTKEAVKEIQRKHGLVDDGIVGPLTKIAIYNEKKSLKIPHIAHSRVWDE
jgi:general secretion pathway protein A